jgi:hypothetical protein
LLEDDISPEGRVSSVPLDVVQFLLRPFESGACSARIKISGIVIPLNPSPDNHMKLEWDVDDGYVQIGRKMPDIIRRTEKAPAIPRRLR